MGVVNKVHFGDFLSKMAERCDQAEQSTVDAIKEKIAKDRQEEIERKVLRIYEDIQKEVARIRELRGLLDQSKARIKALETKAESVLNGKD